MPLIVKGNYKVGEEIKLAPQPSNTMNFRNMSEIREELVKNAITRTAPVKTETVPDEKYIKVEEAELIKHYNTKSSYLADMISIDTDSK
jgi:hypothetical protein